jgi:6-pyruvoyltetrahydropterin/6-carboxytetrahydropterin synthase
MYQLKIVSQFAAAHQLIGFKGGCENLHGHNWKIEVYVTGMELGKDGLLIDFKLLKEATRSLNPSSENIARHVFESISHQLNSQEVRVSKVTAWESDSACASYLET